MKILDCGMCPLKYVCEIPTEERKTNTGHIIITKQPQYECPLWHAIQAVKEIETRELGL